MKKDFFYKSSILETKKNQNPSDFSQCRASAGPQRRACAIGSKEYKYLKTAKNGLFSDPLSIFEL